MTATEWNAWYKVGQPVVVTLDDGSELETHTRREAWELFDGTPVVAVVGLRGGYELDRVRAMETHQNLGGQPT